MEQFDVAKPSAVSSIGPSLTTRELIRSCIASRWGLTIGGTAIVVAGLALGWNWLTAVGLAPLIIGVAPCLIMCALGICMMSRGSSSSATQNSIDQQKSVEPTPTTTQSGGPGT
jgi:hypothetical protein